MKKQVIIDARREGYGIDQISRTMTVGDLIQYLQENFDEDSPIYLSHDNGYTYGGIREEYINENEEHKYSHDVLITEQTYEEGEDGYTRQTGDEVILSESLDERPWQKSFYCYLCAQRPDLCWEPDDGDDWDDDDDTDYCQYVAYPDPSNHNHHFLAVYNRNEKEG